MLISFQRRKGRQAFSSASFYKTGHGLYRCSLAVVMFLVFSFSACKQSVQQQGGETATDTLENNAGGTADTAYARGARLIAANDCLTCHKLDEQSVGPSYSRISQHYEFSEGTIENLAHSIINGSTGLWGKNQMTPHPNVSFQDAKSMAAYVLSLKHTHPATFK